MRNQLMGYWAILGWQMPVGIVRVRNTIAGAVLCTDGKKSYSSVAACCGVLHKQLNIKAGVKVLEQVYHIQNVNAYDSRLKGWMRRFHGVATKYLQNYLGWRRWIDARKNPSPMSFLQRAIYPKNTFPRVMLI